MKPTDLLTMAQFVKVPVWRQLEILSQNGTLIDTYYEGCRKVKVYFYNQYFVEETSAGGRIIDMIPYKRGFKAPPSANDTTGKQFRLNVKNLLLCA